MAEKEDVEVLKALLPVVGIGTAIIVVGTLLVRVFVLGRRVYQDGQYLVSVRFPGQRHDIRSFVQPDNPDVVAVYSQIGPDAWQLLDFVCRHVSYKREVGEHWQFPSETLAREEGDCEDSALLTCSLLKNFNDGYVALGSYQGYGHAWCQLNGQILETTYIRAQPVPDPEHYIPYVLFDDRDVIELWPGALGEVFELGRDEPIKLSLMAEASQMASVSNPDASWVVPLIGSGIIAGAILMAASIKRS